MQLLPGQNFLLERGFFSLNICNFHRKMELTVSFDLEHILNHRFMGLLEFEGTSGDIWPNSTASTGSPTKGHIGSCPGGIMSRRRVHSLSGQLFQYPVPLTVQKFFLMFRWNSLCLKLCCCPSFYPTEDGLDAHS